MKALWTWMCVVCLGAGGAGVMGCSKGFGSSFEGTITMHTTRPGGTPQDLSIKAKGDRLRFETKTPDGTVAAAIYVPQDNKVTVLLDTQKVAMDMNLAQPGAPQPNVDPTASAASATGKKEKVAGYDCEDWVVKDPSGKRSEVCIAKGLAYFDLESLREGSSAASWSNRMRTEKMFPLRTVDYDASGKETSRTEVTEVKTEKLDDAQFAVPAGYARMSQPQAPPPRPVPPPNVVAKPR